MSTQKVRFHFESIAISYSSMTASASARTINFDGIEGIGVQQFSVAFTPEEYNELSRLIQKISERVTEKIRRNF